MKIYIKDIPNEGLNIDATVASHEIGLNDDIFKCLSPLAIKARIEKADDAVLAKVEVKATYEVSCARCLEPIVQERADQFDLYFELTPQLEQIDMGEEIRQEVVIVLSGIMLCHNECQGICPDCGVNLNKEACRCPKPSPQEAGVLRSSQKP